MSYNDDELFDIADLIPGVPKREAHKRCRRGEIPARKVGRRWLSSPRAIREWLGGSAKAANDSVEAELIAAGFRRR